MNKIQVLLILLLAAFPAVAQPLSVTIEKIDATRLPRMKMEVAVLWNGNRLPNVQGLALSVIENGVSLPADVWCPDTASGTAVALVLDNSGSMSNVSFDSLKAGALSVVRMLGTGDEAAIYHFSNGGERVIDFTGDVPALEAAITRLSIGAGTPLYHTMSLALQDLAGNPAARKFLLVFTDGIDNQSSELPLDVADEILAQGVTLFMIGYGNNMLSQGIMQDVARRSGGYYQRVYAPAQLATLLREMGEEMLTQNCVITWESSCTDSLRALHVTAQYQSEVAEAETLFVSPWRPDELALQVAGPARMLPGDRGIIYVDLDPHVPRELPLSFDFLLRADPELLEPTALVPVTLGTITQNTTVQLSELRPGVYRFSAEYVQPGMETGHLVGISLRALAATSSRLVHIEIDSVTLSSGCPNTVSTSGLDLEICQCVETLTASMDTAVISPSGGEVDVRCCWEYFGGQADQLRGEVRFDERILSFVDVFSADLSWQFTLRRMEAGRLVIEGEPLAPSSNPCMLLRFRSALSREVLRDQVSIPRFTAYAQCCMDADSMAALVYVDGVCQPLVRRVPNVEFFPQPVSAEVTVQGKLDQSDEVHSGTLRLYALDGTLQLEHPVAITSDGAVDARIDLSDLHPGSYTAVLHAGDQFVVRTIVKL